MSKNIGIYTFWNVPNYGSFLQAYALQKAIQAILPKDNIKQIAHLNEKHYNAYYDIIPKQKKLWMLKISNYINSYNRYKNRSHIEALKKFIFYYDEMIPHTNNMSEKDIKHEKFDAVVLGSDIVWDYSIKMFGNDRLLFGDGFNSNTIIAYAPSFGTVKNQKPPKYVVDSLAKMNAISVRDENSVNLVKEYVDRDAKWVIDPTFLIDFNSDEHLKRPKYDDYIVVYGSSFTERQIKEARAYADKNSLKLICLDSLDDTYSWCDETVSQADMNPFDWCSYFKYAKAVFTCTYHGLMFGLIFNKPIAFNPTPFIMDKADNFINYLDLYDVLVKMNGFVEKISWNWDYEKINKKIEKLTEESMRFLRDSLTGV